jgi:hypothetical protein
LSPLVWFFLSLPEEVLALLFLLHRENGDFSILMKDIVLDLVGMVNQGNVSKVCLHKGD